jgi:hypothetical protein
MKTIVLWALAFIAALWTAGTALAQQGTSPASQQEGFECIIDFDDTGTPLPASYEGPTVISIIPPSSGETMRLCTGSSPNENIKLECNASLPDWPADETYFASGFVCMIDTNPCDVAAESGLVEATRSRLEVDGFGAAILTCFWQPK